jgi:hypothetical protein
MTGIELIAAERKRQIELKGWTAEHDDTHECNELIQAAVCYLHESSSYEIGGDPPPWPWPRRFESGLGRSGYVRSLTKAGALIAAEIDRLQRGMRKSGSIP